MDLNQAIIGRRAVREYAAEPVEQDMIRHLIAAAIQAPSAVNEQQWTFTVVRNQALLDRISDEAKAHTLATMPPSAHPHFTSHLTDPLFQIFYHAPVLILISANTEGVWNVEDCALAAENLMPRLLLDWVRATLLEDAGRSGGTRTSRRLGSGCPHHRRTSGSGPAACATQIAGDPLGGLKPAA